MSQTVKEALGYSSVHNPRVVGLYFSADYCKWCKEFTPKLRDLYPFLRTYDIEVVLVASDKTETAFDNYRAQQPWPAIRYDDETRVDLRDEFQVKTIPALIFLDQDGNVLNREGRALIDASADKDTSRAVDSVASRLGVCPFSYDSDNSDF